MKDSEWGRRGGEKEMVKNHPRRTQGILCDDSRGKN